MRRVCVFCGASAGNDPAYAALARSVGQGLARRGIGVVYGGGRVGLMGVVADEVLRLGGRAVGVIPRPLWQREVGHTALSEIRIVETMHERKAMMADLSDAFIALPGGLGTIEEIFEIWTWAQLGMHAKPLGFLNVLDYYTPLMAFLDHAAGERFIREEIRRAAMVDESAAALLRRFTEYVPPPVAHWIDREKT